MGIEGKTIAVTGGAGSIGSALVSHLLGLNAMAVRAIDTSEGGLYELGEAARSNRLRTICADVRDTGRMRQALDGCEMVYHAAALKHVEMCEYNADMAVSVNVGGTISVLDAADAVGVQRFMLISTDKAACPVSTMGVTKLLAERVVSSSHLWRKVEASSIRFGNVFGSRGSVVPTWWAALKRGEPIRITDESATRFTISVGEAVAGVVHASLGGRFAGLDEPDPVVVPMKAYWIMDLAAAVTHVWEIVELGKWKMEFVGLRPGERMHEMLTEGGVTSEHAPRVTREELGKMVRDWVEENG